MGFDNEPLRLRAPPVKVPKSPPPLAAAEGAAPVGAIEGPFSLALMLVLLPGRPRRRQKKATRARAARTATPPTVQPTMRPMFGLEEEELAGWGWTWVVPLDEGSEVGEDVMVEDAEEEVEVAVLRAESKSAGLGQRASGWRGLATNSGVASASSPEA